MSFVSRVAGAAAIIVATTACESAPPATYAARDSAGVRIVENTAPMWALGEAWTVAAEPALSLGAIEGAPEVSFDGIQAVLRLESGTLAVIDRGSAQIRFFDASGDFLRAFGGPGDGPGEFRAMRAVGTLGDSVWITDLQLGRLTVVDALSDGFRATPMQGQRLTLGSAGVLTDGSIVMAADLTVRLGPDNLPPNGLQRFESAYVHIARTGELVDTVLIASGREAILRADGATIQVLQPLFGRSVSHALRDELLLFGDQEGYEIRAYQLDGALAEITRRVDGDLSISDADRRAALDAVLATVPEEARPGLRTTFEGMETPPTRPAFRTLLVDESDHLWVQDYAMVGTATTWSVFSPEGVWLGDVTFAGGFLPTQILEGEVIGVWRDELDVEYVRSYALDRS